MANEHPFQTLFETLGRVPTSHAESVNRQAYEILSDILSVPIEKTGRCILLRAPRAGHGKTHLLSRIQHQLGSSYEFVPLHAAFGCRIDAATVTDDTLRRLVRQLPASGGLTILDLVSRRLFASSLQPLVGSGEVPCQDREGALTALRTRPIETFDFHHPNAVTAHWARENFEVLGQRLSHELAQRSGLPVREVAFWVEALFRFASAPLENSNRVRLLVEAVHGGTGAEMERLEALLGLLTLLVRVVLVADDLEGFSTDETAALRLASFLGTLRQSVERVDVILSLNQDIWQSAFVPRLSGGLADRLSEVVVELEPLTDKEMAALLDSRVPGLGDRVLERIDIDSAGTHARGLIRAAGMAWLKATAMDSDNTPPAVASPVPAEPAPAVEEPIPVLTPASAGAAFKVVSPEPEPAAPSAPAPAPESVTEASAPEFSPASSAAEAPAASWPAPEFNPAPPVETAPEPVAWQPPVDAPFQVDATHVAETTPAAETAPDAVVEEAVQEQPASIEQPVTSWNPPVSSAEPSFESASYQPVADSPFQISQEPSFTPEPPAPAEWQPSPPVDSPFQIAASQQAQETTFTPAGWQETPQQSFQPVQDSPFQVAEPAFQPEPSTQSLQPVQDSPFHVAEPAFQPQPHAQSFQPVQDSPFQVAGEQPFTPPAQPATFQPTVDSPFQVAPQGPVSQPELAFQPESAFQPAFQPEQAFQSAPESPEVTPPPASADTDRVDDLLRQFRERYGRGSL